MAATLVGLMWWDRPLDETLPPAAPAAETAAPAARIAAPAAPPRPDAAAGPESLSRAKTTPPSSAGTAAGPALQAPSAGAAPTAVNERPAAQKARAPGVLAQERTRADAGEPAGAPQAFAPAPARRSEAAAAPQARLPPPVAAPVDATGARKDRPVPAARAGPRDAGADEAAARKEEAHDEVAATTPSARAEPAPAKAVATAKRQAMEVGRLAKSPSPAQPSTAEPVPPTSDEAAANALADRRQADESAGGGRDAQTRLAGRSRVESRPATGAGAAPRTPGSEAPAAGPLGELRDALDREGARWTRLGSGGRGAAVGSAVRRWLAEVDAAASAWQDESARPAGPARADAADDAATVRLLRDGRSAAVVRIDNDAVTIETDLAGVAKRRRAALAPEVAARLRAALPAAPN